MLNHSLQEVEYMVGVKLVRIVTFSAGTVRIETDVGLKTEPILIDRQVYNTQGQ
jgi:hypothetical protein